MDLSHWIVSELDSENTKAGKAFSAAMSQIALNMASSLKDGK